MKELWYIGFYLLYLGEWIYNLFRYRDANLAYSNIRFEREAYSNDSNLTYLDSRKPFAWIHIKSINNGKKDNSRPATEK